MNLRTIKSRMSNYEYNIAINKAIDMFIDKDNSEELILSFMIGYSERS